MTAITAIIHWDGAPVQRGLLDAANACVRQRCPDGAWAWADGMVGLAQADLATLPEDTPGQPVRLGQLRIAASCRIDNRAELRAALPGGLLPADAPDAGYILAAYAHWGERCVERLIGDFAFAIWDAERRRLFAARDIFGTRQLFYYRRGAQLVVASDRTQIFQDPRIPLEVDEEQLVEYLTPTFQWTSGWDLGMFRNLYALPAGCSLSAGTGAFEIRRYWEWRDREPDRRPEAAVLEEYLHLLDQAVRCRLRTRDARVGIELSGGLDSPAVAALAARVPRAERPELHSFSLVFDELPQVDERHRIQPVLDRYPELVPHFIVADRMYGPKFIKPGWSSGHIGSPHELLSAEAMDQLYATASQAGCRVMLTGQLGDAVNGGWQGVFYDLMRRGEWREIARRLSIDWQRRPRRALGAVAYYMLALLAPWPLLRSGRALWERSRAPFEEIPAYFAPSLRQRIRELDQAIRIYRATNSQVRCPSVQQTLSVTFPPMVALTMPTPYPIERRHPYTDRRLLDVLLGMPQDSKWEHNQPQFLLACRWHHRKAMVGILPEMVLQNNLGADFTPVLNHNFISEQIAAWIQQGGASATASSGYINQQALLSELKATSDFQFDLFTTIGVEGWLREAKSWRNQSFDGSYQAVNNVGIAAETVW